MIEYDRCYINAACYTQNKLNKTMVYSARLIHVTVVQLRGKKNVYKLTISRGSGLDMWPSHRRAMQPDVPPRWKDPATRVRL